MNTKLDFNRLSHTDWAFWGMRFHFSFPEPSEEPRSMDASISQAPGKEPWGFYEEAKDIESGKFFSTGQFPTMNMEHLSGEKIEQLLSDHKLHFFRRRFINPWFVEYAGRGESFWFDIWVHRHHGNENLFEPQELQQAHIQYLMTPEGDSKDTAEDDLFFDDSDPEWQALNWRWTSIGGYQWQTYDEIKGEKQSYIFGHDFLLPLSQQHYLHFRFYRLNTSNYREANEDFEKLVQFVLQNFNCTLSNEANTQLSKLKNPPPLAAIDFSNLLSKKSLDTWQRFDQDLRNNAYQSVCTEKTPTISIQSSGENKFIFMIAIAAIIIFTCIGKGYFFIEDWLNKNPESILHGIFNGYFVVVLLWCLRDRFKKWARRT